MGKIKFTIDGLELVSEEGKTILQVAEENDIYIPHLCHHPDLPDIGTCGLCVVEIDGIAETKKACMTLAEDGMKINTKGEELNKIRRLSMELMLSNHVDDCTTCRKYLKCELQSLIQYLEVSTSRLRRTLNTVPVNNTNPLIVRDLNRCVSCGRCVRVCRDIRGIGALDYEVTDSGRIMVDVKDHGLLANESCKFCGACVEVCPTGALQDKDGIFKQDLNRELGLIPCKAACPAHIDAPKYIRFIKEGKYQEAISVIREKAMFPYSLGYICMQFCESECRRKELNGALSIRELKKFAAEKDNGEWKKNVKYKPKTDKKVAVIGSGPGGLTAAYYLAKSGHEVTVFEKESVAGGMLSFGIPDYRLPKDVVQSEIKEIEHAGVIIKTSTNITNLDELKSQGFDKILIAIGTGKGVRLPIEGANLENVYENIEFLKRYSLGNPMNIGKSVVVLGGGNVAFDCARIAKYMGADEVKIVCLESRDKMTANDNEIEEALGEKIDIINSRTFVSIEKQGDIATGVKCKVVEKFSFDENKKLNLVIKENSDYIINAETIIFATGQRPEVPEGWDIETGRGNSIITEDGMKVKEDIYAVGDAVYGTNSVIRAIAAGHDVAKAIDIDLGGDGGIDDKLAPDVIPNPRINKDDGFLGLERHECCPDDSTACGEAKRCLQCDLRVQLTKPRLWVNYKIK